VGGLLGSTSLISETSGSATIGTYANAPRAKAVAQQAMTARRKTLRLACTTCSCPRP
jgi:hypothetical protein